MQHRMSATTERVTELSESQTQRVDAGATHTTDGVSATVDGHLRLTSIELDVPWIDAASRARIEAAIVQSVDAAMEQVVKSSSQSLSALNSSAEWKAAMGEMFDKGDTSQQDR